MAQNASDPLSFRLGWEEWLGLPDLGLPSMKAKIDTGARTSALHAFDIEPFGSAEKPRVRFSIHPVPGVNDITVYCEADVIDRREVTSSNGETELRFVIETTLAIGERSWPIEVTLTDRGGMAYRMLLGRQAFPEDIAILPGESFCQPELDYDTYYQQHKDPNDENRSLRIAILSREEHNYTTQRLIQEAEERGHTVEVIDTSRCYMAINALSPEIHYDGQKLPHFDAIIPRIGASITAYGTAVIRQFETIGTYTINPSMGITASRDKLHAHQVLARLRIDMPPTAFALSPKDTNNLIGLVGTAPLIIKLLESTQGKGVVLAETRKAAQSVITAFRGLKASFLVQDFVKEASGEDIRCLVIGGKVIAAMSRKAAEGEFRSNLHQGGSARAVRITPTERRMAVKAAKAFGLQMAGVDLLRAEDGPKVIEVNSSPGFEGVERATGKNIASAIYDLVEKQFIPRETRKKKAPKI